MKKLTGLVLALTTTLAGHLAHAQSFQKPEDAVKYRQSAFSLMGTHFGRIGAMATGRAPFDAKVAASDAKIVATLAALPGAGFVAGSDKVGNTKAKPEVWTDSAKFKDLFNQLNVAAAELDKAAQSGNEAQVKTAFGKVAGTCKACHDDFRNK